MTPMQKMMQRSAAMHREQEARRALDVDTNQPIPLPEKVSLIDKLKALNALRKVWANRKKITMKSWKTSLFGSGGLLLIWAPVLSAAFDGDPSTIPNFGLAIATSMPALGLLFARDNNRTSEQVGAK